MNVLPCPDKQTHLQIQYQHPLFSVIAEYDIYTRFNQLVENKTAIYISHRLSSCRFCDDIAVFHEGQMIQRGSHEQLLAEAGSKYCEMWNAQAQYYT